MSENILKLVTLPDIFTIVNALLGLIAIFMAVNNDIIGSQILILIAVMVDGLDGIVARKIEHGVLGSDLDSFADLISFGVAPVALIYSISPKSYSIHLITAFSSAYLVCGMLRLARYNVASSGERFVGIPITAGGLFLATFMIAQPFLGIDFIFISVLLGALSVLMVSRIKYPRIESRAASVLIGSLILIIVILYYLGFVYYIHIAAVLFLLLILYLVSPLILKSGSL
ncbi:MAG: CDP-diacylglycerol--serine O-phosphatidyltransferase [Halobacteriota archaeon]|nr:CDP-diacylglycerol--serine O-phosphatidyltransferase [Halobacteriota archaeon]